MKAALHAGDNRASSAAVGSHRFLQRMRNQCCTAPIPRQGHGAGEGFRTPLLVASQALGGGGWGRRRIFPPSSSSCCDFLRAVSCLGANGCSDLLLFHQEMRGKMVCVYGGGFQNEDCCRGSRMTLPWPGGGQCCDIVPYPSGCYHCEVGAGGGSVLQGFPHQGCCCAITPIIELNEQCLRFLFHGAAFAAAQDVPGGRHLNGDSSDVTLAQAPLSAHRIWADISPFCLSWHF